MQSLSASKTRAKNLTMVQGDMLIQQDESFLAYLIQSYEEASGQQQRFDILKGNVLGMTTNQTGSKFLQRLLDNANPTQVQFLLIEIEDHLSKLMVDNYGNYFCQKLLSACSGDQRLHILEKIRQDFNLICCSKKGTHSIQKFVDMANLEREEVYFHEVLTG